MMSRFVLVFALLLGSPIALAAGDAAHEAGASAAPLSEALQSPDWRIRQQAGLAQGWQSWPDLYTRFQVEQAFPTRNGLPRFRGPAVADARLTPLFLERLLREPDPGLQLALIDVLPRTGGDWSQAMVELASQQQDERLRSVMVASLRYADDAWALQGLRAGLQDTSELVRAEAARAAGWHDSGATLASELISASSDDDAYVRAMAARSLGYLQLSAAFDSLALLLADPEARVRLQAINALERLDPQRLAEQPLLAVLARDPDPAVARAAQRVR